MRVLGLDLGSKTLGMAISDYLGIIANPIGTFRFTDNNLDEALLEVERVVKEYAVDEIVLGLPKHMNGDIGIQANYCLDFKKMIEDKLALKVTMIDERLTSRIAERVMIKADISRKKQKKNVDKLAATIILQSYLDFHSKK